jgi:hypothetical protein
MMRINKKGTTLRTRTSASDQNVVIQDPKKVDREIDDFEKGIMVLKRDYEIFFAGASKQPPTESRNRLQTYSKHLQTLQGISYAQRFRYNSLASRLSTYLDLWNKQMRLKEEGKHTQHHVAKFRQQPRPKTEQPYENLFKDYLKARESTGERSPNLNYDGFSDLLKRQKEALLQKFQCKDVQFYVSVENGRTKLKARTVK